MRVTAGFFSVPVRNSLARGAAGLQLCLMIALATSASTETAWAQQAPPASAPKEQGGSQTEESPLPPVVVEKTKPAAAKKATKKTTKSTAPPSTPTQAAPTAATLGVPGATGVTFPLAAETKGLDDARYNLPTQIGTNAYSMNREVLEA